VRHDWRPVLEALWIVWSGSDDRGLDSWFALCSSWRMEELSSKVVKVNPAYDEVIAYAGKLLVGRAAYETAVRMYPRDVIHIRQGARVIDKSREEH
jgi:hypothetical protein